jgi:hypothetical protein
MSRLKWNFKRYVDFLKSYGFEHGHTEGSHYYYNGRILGVDRVVQVIFSHKEKDCQSIRTIKMGMKHSGIPKAYYEEWDKNEKVHSEIIY